MNKSAKLMAAAFLVLLPAGCSTPRWQIHQVDYSYEISESPEDDYATRNTILLDTRTGRTWMMIPGDEDDAVENEFKWREMTWPH
jgi:hypothetical protein